MRHILRLGLLVSTAAFFFCAAEAQSLAGTLASSGWSYASGGGPSDICTIAAPPTYFPVNKNVVIVMPLSVGISDTGPAGTLVCDGITGSITVEIDTAPQPFALTEAPSGIPATPYQYTLNPGYTVNITGTLTFKINGTGGLSNHPSRVAIIGAGADCHVDVVPPASSGTLPVSQTCQESTILSSSSNAPLLQAQIDIGGSSLSSAYLVYTASFNYVTQAATGPPPDPNPPDTPTDHRFVVTSGDGLKQPCQKGSDGPLRIAVPITRVVGDVDSAGNPLNLQALLDNHVLSKSAKLRIASLGMNGDATPEVPRSDQVRVNDPNGSPILLTGANNTWRVDEFAIDISTLYFAARNPGKAPTPGMNFVQVNIDAGGTSGWCTVVDWVSISFDALAPVIMVHGNGQGDDGKGGSFWDGSVLGSQDPDTKLWTRLQMPQNVTDSFKKAFIPYDNSISMTSDTIASHGKLLAQLVPAKAAEFGAKHVHLICHSKGGLDLRDFLTAANLPKNFGVWSMTTFDTPHHGSIGPSYQLAAKGAAAAFLSDTYIVQQLDINGGTSNTTLAFVEAFNMTHSAASLPMQTTVDGETNPVLYFSFSADMNLADPTNSSDNHNTITFDDLVGLPGQGAHGNDLWTAVMQRVYNISGNVASVSTVQTRDFLGRLIDQVVQDGRTTTFQLNDCCVTQAEARIAPFKELASLKANHSTIAYPQAANLAIQNILAIQPIQ